MTIPVVDRLDALTTTPDLIYGQHHLPTMMALLHFSDVPAIYVCHDWYAENAFAPRFPRILRFVAVDVTCHDRLVFEDGIDEARVRLLPSFVDLDRFHRRSPLPAKPGRALVFGNYTGENPHLSALRKACARRGIQVDVIGAMMNNSVVRPEEVLKDYDIVFAKGRAALEALAVGSAVIIYSGIRFLGEMVRVKDVERLLPLNLGIRTMGDVLTPEELARRIDAELNEYDPEDAAKVTALVRARAGMRAAIISVAELCEEVVAEYAQIKATLDVSNEGPATAAYLEKLEMQRQTAYSVALTLQRYFARFPRSTRFLRSLLRAGVR